MTQSTYRSFFDDKNSLEDLSNIQTTKIIHSDNFQLVQKPMKSKITKRTGKKPSKKGDSCKALKAKKSRSHAHSTFAACERCYAAKIKCNEERPCRGCTKAKVVR